MTSSMPLLDWIMTLLRDDDARQAFQSDPDGYARANGFDDLSSADVYDALCLAGSNNYNGYESNDDDAVHFPPPHHPDNDDDDDGAHYLNNYISNEYTIIDDRDTDIDNSVHQDIDTDGGDFDQTIDNDTVVASGDGATSVGGDNDGNISSAGGDNTTAFGDGDATNANFDGADFGAGSGVNVGDGSSNGNTETNTSVDIDDSFRTQDNDSLNVEDNDNISVSDNDTRTDDHSSVHNDSGSHNSFEASDIDSAT